MSANHPGINRHLFCALLLVTAAVLTLTACSGSAGTTVPTTGQSSAPTTGGTTTGGTTTGGTTTGGTTTGGTTTVPSGTDETTTAAQATAPALTTEPADDSDRAVSGLQGKSAGLHAGLTAQVGKVAQITGEESKNQTLSRFSVWGTDLGSMTVYQDKVLMFGGDTFSSEDYQDWRSNVVFIIDDDTPADGLDIVDAVMDYKNHAKEILGSKKRDNVEMTVIPTHVFTLGDLLYCNFMSVRHWGAAGMWECNFAGLARSEDGGQTWRKLEDAQWPGDSGFIQIASAEVADALYFWGIPAGRTGGVSLMKVGQEDVEQIDQYRYLVGYDQDGMPIWQGGEAGMAAAVNVIKSPVGEISVIYNAYLGNFVMTYLNEQKAAIVLREGVTPWGPWSEEIILAKAKDYPSLYGGFMCPKYVEEDGKTVYFAMSQYFPVYNIMWMKADLSFE